MPLSANGSELAVAEDSLMVLFAKLADSRSAPVRDQINREIIEIFKETLKQPESFNHPFDSLQSVGKISSSDDQIRILTWNISESPSEHRYFGFLQIKNEKNGEIDLYFLNQGNKIKERAKDHIFDTENWYGALYYQLHTVNCSGNTFYTLIGIDFNDIFTNIKIVDVLTLADGIPVFGAPVFIYNGEIRYRLIFEYSSKVVMMLRYFADAEMIIFDHLSPASSQFIGQYRYYGPDFSYDALMYENCYWNHIPDVDWRP